MKPSPFDLRRKSVMVSTLSSHEGREWLFDLLRFCGIGHTPFAADPYATAFNCGQQNFGLKLQGEFMEAAPENYILMMKEAQDARPAPADADPAESDTAAEPGAEG